jgi:glycosyltransferase involved in cell wall biosynthesis
MTAKPDSHSLSIIVPALNEAECIGTVLRGIMDMGDYEELFVVDGGSTDGTIDIAEALGVHVLRQSQPGFGPGLYEAFEAAQGDLICIVDADGSHDWRDIPQMRSMIAEGYDYVLGSRYKGSFRYRGVMRWPWSTSDDDSRLHEWGNLSIVMLAKIFHGYPLSDVMMGLQMWRKSIFETVRLEEPSQAFEAEFKLRVHHGGFRMGEISTQEHPRIGGDAKLNAWTDGLATGRVLLREWWKRRWRKRR